MNKNISVWLMINNGVNIGKVALQKRASMDSFPFICQATWAGKVESGEEVEGAVRREGLEELGDNFVRNFDFLKLKFICKNNVIFNEKNWESYNYFGRISENMIKKAELHGEAFLDFILVDQGSEFYPISSGKDPKNSIVLFDDQYNVLKKILSSLTENV